MAEESQQSIKRCNHQWTAEEDKVLVECLTDLDLCWKGDNGFKGGFSNVVEKMMHSKIPDCSLRANPHITSRVKLLKKQYNVVAEMVGPNGGSGFGWNDAKKMIDVERVIFDDWAKTHPSAKGLFNKPFPHYDALRSIFGKDVATGGSAVGTHDVVNKLERETNFYNDSGTPFDEYLDLTGDYIPNPVDEPLVPNIPTEEAVPQSPVSTVTAKKGKQRSRCEHPLVDVMKDLSEKITNNFDKLVSCFQHQVDGSSRRMAIMDELKKFDELTDPQMVHIAFQLSRDSTMTDVFMQCNDGQRKCLLAGLLAKLQ